MIYYFERGMGLDYHKERPVYEQEYTMISVEEARERILELVSILEPEDAGIFEALDRVLAEDVYSDMNVPPLDNTAMDGYAVRAADTFGADRSNPVSLQVIFDLAAGYTTDVSVRSGTAIRIMTGAPIPPGADAVVPFEETDEAQVGFAGLPASQGGGRWVKIFKAAKLGANIRRAGEDLREGERVLALGTVVRPPEIGLLSSVGRSRVQVHRRPRVAIIATGDELVEINQRPGPGQIRNSNNYTVAAGVLRYGGIPLMLGIARDSREDLSRKIEDGLENGADLIITSGGVSVGDFDVVKQVLAAEGEIRFWRVRMKPGKPLAFGHIQGVPHLGLPGNPVSTAVAFELFVRPALLKMQGKTRFNKPEVEAVFQDSIPRKDDRRHYLRVVLDRHGGQYVARLTGEQGSGILTSMVKANGLVIIPEDTRSVAPGEKVRVMLLDWPEES